MSGFSADDLHALWLTLQLAASVTVLLLLLGLPLAWWLAFGRSALRGPLELAVALPLVLPPTVLGFYLLVALGPQGLIGGSLVALGGSPLVFSFAGLLLGSMVYSLPFAVQPLLDGFRQLGRAPRDVAATLGASPLRCFLQVELPLIRSSVLTAAVLCFAHTLGEFGVVLMIGGNLPGETRVLSIALYDAVESLDFGHAHRLSALLLVTAVLLLSGLAWLRRRGAQILA